MEANTEVSKSYHRNSGHTMKDKYSTRKGKDACSLTSSFRISEIMGFEI